ncbi:flagellar assembly protein FliH [Chitinasiproducens palmae]|uniref:Flagellar assembly protein FliH n=1 Tax=Chitinasiproducens palmae TaxID=1770053 RepID=A0A1H2PLM7_9BURK|nr:flagellar assembly protein FliH [Chitinasiproducens palmae]SDV46935.1 flagellar assembly protein FliH [Chitinasiproducens palmae]
MTRYALYRFPALAEPSPRDDVCQVDPALADGYEAGREIGYADGRQAGHAEGRRVGLAEGLTEGRQAGERAARDALARRFDSVLRTLDRAAAALRDVHAQYCDARRGELIDLVEKVTRQVIRCELTLQPEQLLKLIDGALCALPATDEAPEIHLPPEECARLAELGQVRADGWRLIADRALQAGECRVRAGGQEVDAGCTHRLQACLEQLRDAVESASDDANVAPNVVPDVMSEAAGADDEGRTAARRADGGP